LIDQNYAEVAEIQSPNIHYDKINN